MADDIVQTVRIEVEGTDEAAAAFQKVGDAGTRSFEELDRSAQTAGASVGQAGQQIGKGLDQVSEKSNISGREMKALGKIAKEFGADAAVVGLSLVRMAAVLGPIGGALFGLAEAFSFVKGKMKEAEEAAKAVTATFANITQISAEMKAENDAAYWGTTADALKQTANDASRVADQFRNIANGVREIIDPLTTQATLQKAFILQAERAGIAINDVTADTKKLGEESQKLAVLAARTYENLSLIGKLNFAGALKGLGFTDEQIKNIEKGSAALRQLQLEAAASSFENWRPALENLVQGVLSAGNAIAEFFQRIPAAVDASIAQVTAAFAQVTDAITAWVTTPVANAWQWIADTFKAVLDSIKSAFGLGGGSPAGTTGGSFAGGGLLGGRGTGTSDSNLAWVSRGEYITPARTVAQPGVLAFLEALRRSGGNLRGILDGMGRFALGGLVAPTLSIPAFAGGGEARNFGTLRLELPGGLTVTGRVDEAIGEALSRLAVKSQIRSGGRKPSRYR